MGEGYIKLHRQIEEHWIWSKKPFSPGQAWIDLLIRANHKEENTFVLGNEIIDAERGEVITSEKKLAIRWGWSRTKVRAFLNLLQNDSMIDKKTTNKKTTINICNYCVWQDSQTAKKPQKDRKRTAKRPQKDTIKNDKNDKNDKKNKPPIVPLLNLAEYVSMTNGEHEKLIATYGKEMTARMIEILDNYKGASGKKYKSDYRAILNWVVGRIKEDDQKPKGGRAIDKRRINRTDNRDWEKLLGVD